jgi:hypothetical protein
VEFTSRFCGSVFVNLRFVGAVHLLRRANLVDRCLAGRGLLLLGISLQVLMEMRAKRASRDSLGVSITKQ